MCNQTPDHAPTFGYLSVLRSPQLGYFGGYLIVSLQGRPLEFHCTSPVQPSRAQEILYGPTLHAYLLGEQIGGALLAAAKLRPRLILTDQPDTMAVPIDPPLPVAYLRPPSDPAHGSASTSGPAAASADQHGYWNVAGYEFQLPPGLLADHDLVRRSLELLAQYVDLAEPFGRIHEAIREAQRIGDHPLENYGQAA